jgi:hypothetical protein
MGRLGVDRRHHRFKKKRTLTVVARRPTVCSLTPNQACSPPTTSHRSTIRTLACLLKQLAVDAPRAVGIRQAAFPFRGGVLRAELEGLPPSCAASPQSARTIAFMLKSPW